MKAFGTLMLIASIVGAVASGAVVLRDPSRPLWAIGALQICMLLYGLLVGGRIVAWTLKERAR